MGSVEQYHKEGYECSGVKEDKRTRALGDVTVDVALTWDVQWQRPQPQGRERVVSVFYTVDMKIHDSLDQTDVRLQVGWSGTTTVHGSDHRHVKCLTAFVDRCWRGGCALFQRHICFSRIYQAGSGLYPSNDFMVFFCRQYHLHITKPFENVRDMQRSGLFHVVRSCPQRDPSHDDGTVHWKHKTVHVEKIGDVGLDATRWVVAALMSNKGHNTQTTLKDTSIHVSDIGIEEDGIRRLSDRYGVVEQ